MRHFAILAALLCAAPAVAAIPPTPAQTTTPIDLYVSPTGNDRNTCDSPLVPCRTFNATLARMPKGALAPETIHALAGDYYAPPPRADGGAPTAADAQALIDLEGFYGPGPLTIIGTPQTITTTVRTIVDAGASASGGQLWVKFAPNVAWSGYMVDAGYAFPDGGLVTNALIGTHLTFVSGVDTGLVVPVVSNAVDAIVATLPSLTTNSAVAPDTTSTFTLFKEGVHLHPFPVGTDAGASYSMTTVYANVGGTSAPPGLFLPNIGTIPPVGNVSLQYLGIDDGPTTAWGLQTPVANVGTGTLDVRYCDIGVSGSGLYDVYNYGGTVNLVEDYIHGGIYGYDANTGSVFAVGDFINGNKYGCAFVTHAYADSTATTCAPSDGTFAAYTFDYGSVVNSEFDTISAGNSTSPTIQANHGSTLILAALASKSDGGAGLVVTYGNGTSVQFGFAALTHTDVANLISLDNGETYTSLTAFNAIDGGAAGVHTLCNAQWGNCAANR